eukprot:6205590-Pleurochrysis_carterae.AAC.3
MPKVVCSLAKWRGEDKRLVGEKRFGRDCVLTRIPTCETARSSWANYLLLCASFAWQLKAPALGERACTPVNARVIEGFGCKWHIAGLSVPAD